MQVIHLVPRDNQPDSYFDNLVSISSTLYVQIFCTNVVFSGYVLTLSEKFVQIICALNIDEIDGCSQFHQHFKNSFCAHRSKKSKKKLMT